MKKYLIIALAAFILEVASTMYIKNVADRDVCMLFWAFVGPFLGLPFVGYMIESKNWNERIKIAFSQSVGYFLGSLIVFNL